MVKISLRVLLVFVLTIFLATNSMAEWSKYPACSKQYEKDVATCNSVKTASGRAKCFASASDRLAYCNKTKGEIDSPKLLK